MSALTLTRVTQTHDAATGRVTPSTATYAGAAMALESHEAYRQFGLIRANEVALMWCSTPDQYQSNVRPKVGDTFTWGGGDFTVNDVKPFDPDGVAIFSYVKGER
jgi:hypothetical protein